MNTLVESISRTCEKRLLDEKWLLAPSLRVGWQWLDAASRCGRPLVNLHVKTIQRIVLDAAAPYMAANGLQFASTLQGALLVESIWSQLGEDDNYFHNLEPSLDLFERIYRSLQDLRMAGEPGWDANHFESSLKAKTLQVIDQNLTKALEEAKWIDYSTALSIALERVEPEDGLVVITPEDVELNDDELLFIQRISSHQEVVAEDPQPYQPSCDIDLLGKENDPPNRYGPFQDGSVSIYHALGEANEVREVFRRCIERQIPLDQIEIVLTDPQTYVPLLYEISFEPDWSDESEALPITFSDGVPITYSKPGRALLAWINWAEQEYSQTGLLSLYSEQLIQRGQSVFTNNNLASALRRLPIYFGRERTLNCIQDKIRSLQARLDINKEMYETDEGQVNHGALAWQQKLYQALFEEIERLLQLTPKRDAKIEEVIQQSIQFCERYTDSNSEFDFHSRARTISELNNLKDIVDFGLEIECVNGWQLVKSLLSTLSAMGSGPKPGAIHASHYMTGGQSGRPYVFIVGLDGARFPGAGAQDPIILDSERKAISNHLVTAGGRVQRKIQTMNRLLHRLNENVTLSFSSFELMDAREQFPSSFLLSAYRVINGDQQPDFETLMKSIGAPVSFSPNSSGQCLNQREVDALLAANGQGDLAQVYERYLHLQSGANALQQRQSHDFTVYDGWVAEAGPQLNFSNGRTASASALETLGACPLAFFFRYGLKLEEPEPITVEDEWLDAMVFGSLIHQLFERFIKKRIQANEPVSFSQHRAELIDMAEREISLHRDLYPPSGEHAVSRRRNQIVYCIDTFLRSEESLQKTMAPQFVEARIGYTKHHGQPVALPLPNGESLQACGTIDRIDLLVSGQPNRYAIWDYKTGGTYKFQRRQSKKKWDLLQQGRVVQHAFYTTLVDQWLKQNISDDAQVSQFGYFFPSEKGAGERLAWSADEFTQAGNVFLHLNRIASMGAFLPTNDADDCQFCPYQSICGDVEHQAECSAAKLNNPQTDWLAPMKELRLDALES